MRDQRDRVYLVTGANAGIGFETARGLAEKGARVILGCRNRDRGEKAKSDILSRSSDANVEVEILDLASLDSIEKCAKRLKKLGHLDGLINNAGVMLPPEGLTEDGFELQFGVNYLGHFALTGHLLPLLKKTEGARIVTVSSIAHRTGSIKFQSFREATGNRIKSWKCYEQSKLACLLFALELDERLRQGQLDVESMAAHPGTTKSELQRHNRLVNWAANTFAMETAQGALPVLYAATCIAAKGGEYYGPDGFMEMRGYPGLSKVSKEAQDEALRARLWSESEKLCGVKYDL